MVTLFIVIAGFVIRCYGGRFCDFVGAQHLEYLIAGGFVELLFESAIPAIKIYKRKKED